MDPRAVPETVLGLKPMEAFCLTNVSGRIRPAVLNDIASLDSIFSIEQVIIMHHSNCGSTHGTIDQLHQDLESHCPELSPKELEDVVRNSAIREDNDRELKADLKILRECKYIRKELTEVSSPFPAKDRSVLTGAVVLVLSTMVQANQDQQGAAALWYDVDTGLAREVSLESADKV